MTKPPATPITFRSKITGLPSCRGIGSCSTPVPSSLHVKISRSAPTARIRSPLSSKSNDCAIMSCQVAPDRSSASSSPQWNGNPIGSKAPFHCVSGVRGMSKPDEGSAALVPAVSVSSSTRLRESTIGSPRRSSASSTFPRIDRNRKQTRRARLGALDLARGCHHLRLEQASWVRQDHHVRAAGPRGCKRALEPLTRMRRKIAGLDERGQGRSLGRRDFHRLAPVAGGRQPDGNLLPLGLAHERDHCACKHQSHVSPGANTLIEQQHELIANRLTRLFAMEVQELSLGEPADELFAVERELNGQDPLGRARVVTSE